MTATILDGREIARSIQERVARDVEELARRGSRPRLVSVRAGTDPSGEIYLESQRRASCEVGIEYDVREIPAGAGEEEIASHVMSLNYDPLVTGLLVQLPLPPPIDPKRIQEKIWPEKDVEGMNPANLGRLLSGEQKTTPCTAMAVLTLLRHTDRKIRGAEVTIVGHSNIVGRPLAMLLAHEMATVTLCHEATRDLAAHTRRADILIVAVGKPGLVTGDMVRPGAVVIDVGISRVPMVGEDGAPLKDEEGATRTMVRGDVDFEGVRDVAGFLTPVPGGVGPVTVATLFANTASCARNLLERRSRTT